MVAKKNKTSEKDEKKGRVKVGKLRTTRELSANDAKKVKGGTDFNFVHVYDKATPVLLQSDPKK
jgi:type VI protein secretion system component Hcp